VTFKPDWLHQWEVPRQLVQFILPDGKPGRVKLDGGCRENDQITNGFL